MVSLLLGGCGAAGASEPGGSAADVNPSGAVTTAPPAAQSGIDAGNDIDPADAAAVRDEDQPAPMFPMTLRRTGGIADYADRVVVQSDGRVTVDTRDMTGRTCTLAAAQRTQLLAALTALRLAPPDSTGAPTDVPSDGSTGLPVDGNAAPGAGDAADAGPITLSVTDDLTRTFDLTDPSLAGVTDLLGSVVTNVTLTLPAGATCTTPTDLPAPTPSVTTGLIAAG